MKLSIIFSLVAGVLLLESQLIAAPILIQYQAEIRTVSNNFLGYTHTMTTPVTGTFLFDTSIADSNANINRGHYQHAGNGGFTASFQATNGGNPIAVLINGSGSPEVRVEWFPTSLDTWRYWDGESINTTMLVNGIPNGDVDLGYAMSKDVFFSSDANTNPWPLAVFGAAVNNTPHTFVLSDPNGSISLRINSATVVPEPSTVCMILAVFGGLLIFRGRFTPAGRESLE